MEKCEIHKEKKTLSYPISEKGLTLILCPIDNCPYGNLGKYFPRLDDSTEYHVCDAQGIVEKSGKIREIPEKLYRSV